MLSHRDCCRYNKVLTILCAMIIPILSFPVGRAVKGFNLSRTVIGFLFFLISLTLYLLPLTAIAGTIQLPQTGQKTCYDTNGVVILCPGTGQDGDIQAGVPWPNPRFIDHGDGTVTDNLSGLMWTKDANLSSKTWQQAL